ncbi:hypothetical protein TELCIR_02905 [Teladorsagia circumcincta]|uniref:Uncharacterized protein n=1 Tax=Teladorsagia circumcincta TaxID=45464 RepID=A0A2G9UZA9_TELCI|nr:hypothetical protein TELCIR_02905 [Teladorsagia circumcincta]
MRSHFVDGGGDFFNNDISSEGAGDSDSDGVMQEVEEYFFELLVDMEMVTRLRSAYPTKIILAQDYLHYVNFNREIKDCIFANKLLFP